MPSLVEVALGHVVRRALVAGVVADRLLADVVGLVGRLALLGLAGGGRVRVRVAVQIVVLGARHAAVGGRRGRAALVVGPVRRSDDDEALAGAVVVALAEQRRDIAEPDRRVVADRLRRGQERDRRAQELRGV